MRRFKKSPNFYSLSVKDLLEARESFHVFLASMDNVVGTAIGLYRIRKTDPDAEDWKPQNPEQKEKIRKASNPRTLEHTIIRPWSWPCVLVFVNEWKRFRDILENPDELIPRYLYLPDGRMVPTCVIEATKLEQAPPRPDQLDFPEGLIGGGYPVLTETQDEERIGSLAALASDGPTVYALTNRHVAGKPGSEIFTIVSGERRRFGVAHHKSLGKVPFAEVYPGWPGNRVFINADASLIRMDSLWMCTSQVYGIGEIGEPIDLNVDTISLDLIGTPVCAYGGASGRLEGEIQALFYRYQTMGGYDYVADFLIGPREGKITVETRPGDSGTLWFWDIREEQRREAAAKKKGQKAEPPESGPGESTKPIKLRPLAMQWGGHAVLEAEARSGRRFALATGLANILRLLDVELVLDWETGHSEYWGKVGHYKIALAACGLVRDPRLRELLAVNRDRLAPDDERILRGKLPSAGSGKFVELADVSDLEWRASRKKDSAHHFADIDQPGRKGEFKGKTLLNLWKKDKKTLHPQTWIKFYDALAEKEKMADKNCGALPFRVMQIYEAMTDAVRHGLLDKFICAAGIIAHYVADACQPLHISHLHHGRENHPEEADVHAYYDNKMLDRFRAELISGLNARLQGTTTEAIFEGRAEAGNRVMALMEQTVEKIPPLEVVEIFNSASSRERSGVLWSNLKDRIFETMAGGAVALAEIWESAWLEGGGQKISAQKIGVISGEALKALYDDKSFLPASWLREMAKDWRVNQKADEA